MNTYYEWKCSMCNRNLYWNKETPPHCSIDGTIMIKQINGDTLVQADPKEINELASNYNCCGVPLEEVKEDDCKDCEDRNLHLNSENN